MIDRHHAQVRFILSHRYRYYELSEPVLEDLDFDKAFKVLEKIERDNPELISSYSPTQYAEAPPCGWVRWFQYTKDKTYNLLYGVKQ